MLEIKEQETLPFPENNQPPEEINKYHKRIDDLIEDAEIEAEIEAEKKIRSKNSRMFSISDLARCRHREEFHCPDRFQGYSYRIHWWAI